MKKNYLIRILTLATLMVTVCCFSGCQKEDEIKSAADNIKVEKIDEVVKTEEAAASDAETSDEEGTNEKDTNAGIEENAGENPGSFDTADFSVSYDTEKWSGSMDGNSVVTINYLGNEVGPSHIEIFKSEFSTAKEAISSIAESKGQNLSEPSQFEMNGCTTYSTWNDISFDSQESVVFDMYLVFEKDGKVVVVDECITRDTDNDGDEEFSYIIDDVISTLQIK